MAFGLHYARPMVCRRRNVFGVIAAVGLSLAWAGSMNVSFADDTCTPAYSNGTEVSIPFQDSSPAASDLICDSKCLAFLGQSGAPFEMDPEQAGRAKERGLDLSTLEPDLTSDVYKGVDTTADDSQDNSLDVQNWERVSYNADVCSSSGRYRFNVTTYNRETYTVMLSRDLHSFLLRKELLRKLGYKIPAIKYLPHIKVHFDNRMVPTGATDPKTHEPIMERLIDRVLTKWLPDAANGNAKRWCGMAQSALDAELKINKDYPCSPIPDSDVNGDPYTIELQDVILMQSENVYYDLAIGPPISQIPGTTRISPAQMRIVRSLSLVYGLLDIPESVNQFGWYAAQKDNNQITLHVPDQENFGTTMDDALWMARKIAKLTRQDFEEIVANSYYPDSVAKLIVEKLIARRNSIAQTFGLPDPAISFDPKITAEPGVKNGKVTQISWPGYASDFAYGDQQSPLQGIQWYILSEVQANAMEALMNKVNQSIPQLNEQDAYNKHGQEVIMGLIQKSLETNTIQTLHWGAWFAPLLNGSVQISRDVVLGQYLGTNDIVQLADTFGFTMQAGLLIGVDIPPSIPMSLSGSLQGTVSISLMHLMPITPGPDALKNAATQPLEKEIVAWVFKDASDAFKKIADEQSQKVDPKDPVALQNANTSLQKDVDLLQKYLAPGESLILTESLAGDESVTAGYSPSNLIHTHHNLMPSLGPTLDMNEQILSRIHFYRLPAPNSNTIMIYKDSGNMIDPTISLEFTLGSSTQFPVLSLQGRKMSGTARTKVFNLSINPDASQNPGISEVAGGIASALRTGSTEVLESQLKIPAMKVAVSYKDSSSSAQLFHWLHRTLKTDGTIDVTMMDGNERRYITMTDGKQSGTTYQSLGTEAASFLVQRLTGNPTYSVDTQVNPNSGQTFFGHSQTRDTMLQGRLDSGVLSEPYVRVNYRWEGWDLSSKNARELVAKLNDKYGVQFYDPNFLGTTTDIKLYEVLLSLNIYKAGIEQVMSMSKQDEKAFEKKYWDLNRCDNYTFDIQELSGTEIHHCATLENFEDAMWSYHKDSDKVAKMVERQASRKDLEKQSAKLGKDMLTAVQNAEQFMEFQDFVNLLGGVCNPTDLNCKPRIYIASQITGFREGAEQTEDPISPSQTFGNKDLLYPTGVVDWIEGKLGIDDGEFYMKWLRSVL